MRQRRIVLTVFALIFGLLAGLSGWAFHVRYWVWRGQFGTEGRAYDPRTGEAFVEQAGLIWGGLCVTFTGLAAGFARGALRAREEQAELGLGQSQRGAGP
jgi:hypothetical protein